MNIELVPPQVASAFLEDGKARELHRIIWIAKVFPEGDISRLAVVKVTQFVMATDAMEALEVFSDNIPDTLGSDLTVGEKLLVHSIAPVGGVDEDSIIIQPVHGGPRAVEH